MHYSYDTIVSEAKKGTSIEGYYYALVSLRERDTSDNPTSTKHNINGPGIWLWIIHPSAITIREIEMDKLAVMIDEDELDAITRIGVWGE